MLRSLTPAPTGPCPVDEGFWGLQEGGHENNTDSPFLHILCAGRGAEGFMEEVAQGSRSLTLFPPHPSPQMPTLGPTPAQTA